MSPCKHTEKYTHTRTHARVDTHTQHTHTHTYTHTHTHTHTHTQLTITKTKEGNLETIGLLYSMHAILKRNLFFQRQHNYMVYDSIADAV